jgi:hypothetical protein
MMQLAKLLCCFGDKDPTPKESTEHRLKLVYIYIYIYIYTYILQKNSTHASYEVLRATSMKTAVL